MNVHSLLTQRPGPMLAFVPEPDAEQLARCLVALANSAGGTIVLGADERGRVYDDGSDEVEPVIARALQMLQPPLRHDDLPEVLSEETSMGARHTCRRAPASYQLSVEGRDSTCASATEPAPEPRAGGDMAGTRGPREFEDEIVPGATLADLDDDVIDEYQRNRLRRGPRGEALPQRAVARVGRGGRRRSRDAGRLLLFGRQPQQFLPRWGWW